MLTGLAIAAVVPAVATPYFALFWWRFEFWRRHRAATYAMMLAILASALAAAIAWRAPLLAAGVDMPTWARTIGWVVCGVACLFGTIADRQLGFHVRSFTPFFTNERIRLRTTGAYNVVRHPIYASGIWFQLGALLVTGRAAVAAAWLVLTLGALWFTRQEERRLAEQLDDPKKYDRYRRRVPALFPF